VSRPAFGTGASISDAWNYRGFPAIVLENDRVRLTILPTHGAKVAEFVSKASDRDLLYHHPRFDVRPPVFGANVDDWWTGGIDEVAPTGHAAVVGGEQLPFLGEFWSQAWSARIVDEGPSSVAVELGCAGIITPLRIDRRMELRAGESFIRSTHRLTNVGHEPVPFMWGIHPGIAIRPGARIQVPGRTATFHEGHPGLGVEPGTRFRWPDLPAIGGSIDLSVARPPDPPSWELVFVDELTAGWLAVTDPASRSGFAMSFDLTVFPVAWLWGVYGGWRGLYAVALEAWTAHPPRLDEVIAAGRARTLSPGEHLETEIRFIAFDGIGSVADVSPDGAIRGDG
jgi:Domain of unknown function (DUF4432)